MWKYLRNLVDELFIIKPKNMKILIDNGHGEDTKGKRSPDGFFREYSYARYIASMIVTNLKIKGYDAELLVTEENDISLKERVRRVNEICDKLGSENVLLISIHNNACGDGTNWMNGRGWSAYTTKGDNNSDKLAEILYKEAKKNFEGKKIRIDNSDGDMDWEENFYIIKNSKCVSVLTENFFMDNKDDIAYLCSDEGKNAIIETHINGIIEYLKTLKH